MRLWARGRRPARQDPRSAPGPEPLTSRTPRFSEAPYTAETYRAAYPPRDGRRLGRRGTAARLACRALPAPGPLAGGQDPSPGSKPPSMESTASRADADHTRARVSACGRGLRDPSHGAQSDSPSPAAAPVPRDQSYCRTRRDSSGAARRLSPRRFRPGPVRLRSGRRS